MEVLWNLGINPIQDGPYSSVIIDSFVYTALKIHIYVIILLSLLENHSIIIITCIRKFVFMKV